MTSDPKPLTAIFNIKKSPQKKEKAFQEKRKARGHPESTRGIVFSQATCVRVLKEER